MRKNLFITHIRGLIAKGVIIDSLGEKVKELAKGAKIRLTKSEIKDIIKAIEETSLKESIT